MVVSVFRPQKGASNQSQLVAVQFGHDRTVVRRRGKKGGRGFYMGGGEGGGGFYIRRERGGAGFADLIQNPTFKRVGDS